MTSTPEVEKRPPEPAVPPEWQVTVRRMTKEDGRYLIYYEFTPSPEAPEIALEGTPHATEESR